MRLIITLLLICTLPATNVVPFGHTHEVDQLPADHHARPHVHLHGHEHEHGHAHHGHYHANGHAEADLALSISPTLADHDDDAIYYIDTASLAPANEGRAEAAFARNCIAVVVDWPASVALSPPEAVAEPPPRIRIDGPPLYLRHLSLRI